MAKQVVHLSKVTERKFATITGTLCNRMTNDDDGINCTEVETEVTCKLCLNRLKYRKAAA